MTGMYYVQLGPAFKPFNPMLGISPLSLVGETPNILSQGVCLTLINHSKVVFFSFFVFESTFHMENAFIN
jgi:hypothetical protein